MNKAKNRIQSSVIAAVAVSIALMTFNTPISAQSIEVSQQGNQQTATPQNGLKMDEVVARFGEPLQKLPAVGQPPISRWVYSDYTVYFENNIVLHSVIHPKAEQKSQ